MSQPVVLTGDKEVDKKLAALGPKLQKKLSRQATRKAAKDIVLPAAQAAVPVDTGELEDSLKVRAVTRKRGLLGHMVVAGDGFYIGDQYYGGFIEFGTKERATRTGLRRGSIQPSKHAYLRPAIYNNETRIRKLFVDTVRQFIQQQS